VSKYAALELEFINLKLQKKKIIKEQDIKAAKVALFGDFRLRNKYPKPAPSSITFSREIEV
jgi:hypothetical protein